MTEEEKIEKVKALAPDINISDDAIGCQLEAAKDAILDKRYPFGIPEDVTDVESRYEMLQCQMAVRLISRMGAEDETAHSENGINRTYLATVAGDLIARVIPYAGF